MINKNSNRTKIICVLIILIMASVAIGDENKPGIDGKIKPPGLGMTHIIILEGGSKLVGRIVEQKEGKVVIDTDLGIITVEAAKIIAIETARIGTVKGGSYWFENPNTTRLYFAPTGRMLKKGSGYFSDYLLFFPGIAYGLTDNVTIGGGVSLFPGVDFDEQIVYFTPKIGLKATGNTSIAAGALIISLPDIGGDSPTVGILYGAGTFGGLDGSLTTGLGFGFVDGDFSDRPLFMMGGEKRLSRRISFVSENWFLPGVDNPLISYGFRFFGEDLSVDLALLNVFGDDMFFPGLPWMDFIFNF